MTKLLLHCFCLLKLVTSRGSYVVSYSGCSSILPANAKVEIYVLHALGVPVRLRNLEPEEQCATGSAMYEHEQEVALVREANAPRGERECDYRAYKSEGTMR